MKRRRKHLNFISVTVFFSFITEEEEEDEDGEKKD